MQKKIVIGLALLTFFILSAQPFGAATTDELYTEVNAKGDYVDGNRSPLKYDRPVIRPSYVGSSVLNDYIGPEGQFKGFWGEQPKPYVDNYYGHEYSVGRGVIIRNVGFYEGKKLAIKIAFTNKDTSWIYKVTLARDGGLNISPNSSGIEFRLVYDDGVYQTPVEWVYVELPVLSEPTAYNDTYKNFSYSNIKSSNLKRFIYNSDSTRRIKNEVSRESKYFLDNLGEGYSADSLRVENQFYRNNDGSVPVRVVEQTFVFDNNEPLVLSESRSLNQTNVTTLFKSQMKTPGEISYLPPRSNGAVNSTKFEANFDLTQAVNDGYDQYYPDTLSLVMSDHEKKFNTLQLSGATFSDKDGKNISNYFETIVINNHELEFRIKKTDLIKLRSNQINVKLSADNLNSEEVLKGYDPVKNVYQIPMTFYNYKIYKGKKTESEKMLATAEITPNIYGEAADDVTAEQYTTSDDLDINKLLKNVATTIPGDTGLEKELVDKTIKFDEVKTYQVRVRLSSQQTGDSKIISVPVAIIKAVPVEEAFFEHQKWLINEINRQFEPKQKKIGKNLYMSDLLQITEIKDLDASTPYTGQYIPKRIDALKNLRWLELSNKKLGNTLPEEMGSLTKLVNISIYGSELTGVLPESLGNLRELQTLDLAGNRLSGSLPRSLLQLSHLVKLDVSDNQLVGEVLTFPTKQLATYNVSRNQVTYNDASAPGFMSKATDYGNTLINNNPNIEEPEYLMWSLTGVKGISIPKDGSKIKPFEPTNSGYFGLKLTSTSGQQKLYPAHTYKIMNTKTDEIMYQGVADKELVLTVNLEEDYLVILDGADKNPNNRFKISSKRRELKLLEIPKQLEMSLKAGDTSYQPVKIISKDSLTVFDNRINSHWQLRVKPTKLVNTNNLLAGSYYYKRKEILTGQFNVIEEGDSQPSSERIPISADWNDTQGLGFKQQNASNHKGGYQGKLEWQLVDAPGS